MNRTTPTERAKASMGFQAANRRACCRNCSHATQVQPSGASNDAYPWRCTLGGFGVTAQAICGEHQAHGQEPGSAALAASERYMQATDALIAHDLEAALILVTGTFVSLTLSAIREQGHEPVADVLIDGGINRNITIHAAKVGCSA